MVPYDTRLQLARAFALLGDCYLVLQMKKTSPPLQKRIETFLYQFQEEEREALERLAVQSWP